jgi:hypothetical protein
MRTKKGIMNRTVNFKFANVLPKGTEVTIRQTNENTYMVMREDEPTIEYLVMKDAVTFNTKSKIKFNPDARLTECLDVKTKADAKEWLKQYKAFHKNNPKAVDNISYMIGYCATQKRRDELHSWYGL